MVTLITSLSYSQEPLLEKTQYKGSNAFIGNEIVMDSIFYTYKAFEALKIDNDSLLLSFRTLSKKNQINQLELQTAKTDNNRLNLLNTNLQEQLLNRNEKHETEILYYKEKSKGKFKSFLLGTSIGALIVAILALL